MKFIDSTCRHVAQSVVIAALMSSSALHAKLGYDDVIGEEVLKVTRADGTSVFTADIQTKLKDHTLVNTTGWAIHDLAALLHSYGAKGSLAAVHMYSLPAETIAKVFGVRYDTNASFNETKLKIVRETFQEALAAVKTAVETGGITWTWSNATTHKLSIVFTWIQDLYEDNGEQKSELNELQLKLIGAYDAFADELTRAIDIASAAKKSAETEKEKPATPIRASATGNNDSSAPTSPTKKPTEEGDETPSGSGSSSSPTGAHLDTCHLSTNDDEAPLAPPPAKTEEEVVEGFFAKHSAVLPKMALNGDQAVDISSKPAQERFEEMLRALRAIEGQLPTQVTQDGSTVDISAWPVDARLSILTKELDATRERAAAAEDKATKLELPHLAIQYNKVTFGSNYYSVTEAALRNHLAVNGHQLQKDTSKAVSTASPIRKRQQTKE